MARKSIGLFGILVIAALSFAAGYWPEHQKYINAVGDLQVADRQLNEAMGRQRICHLESMMLHVLDRTAQKDYREAQNLATQFFIEVRADIARPDMVKFKPELQAILDKSDGIKDALQEKDSATREALREVMERLARIVAPPTASEPPAVLRASPAPES